MKRGSVTAKGSELIALWVPLHLVQALDEAVALEDSDRSKFIRRALRTRVRKMGFRTELEKEVA